MLRCDKWMKMYELLCEYKQKYGHTNVYFNDLENKKLANWARNQKTLFKNNKLSSQKILKLEGIGFIFDVRIEKMNKVNLDWLDMFKELCVYKEKYGHMNVSKNIMNNQKLNTWISKQREYYAKKDLSIEAIQLLEWVNFEWKK